MPTTPSSSASLGYDDIRFGDRVTIRVEVKRWDREADHYRISYKEVRRTAILRGRTGWCLGSGGRVDRVTHIATPANVVRVER